MTEQNWLGENQLSLDIWNKKYRVHNENFDQWLNRVSGGNEDVKQLIKEKKFLFGGRTLSNRGVPNSGSYSNCYSEGFIPDSLEGIMKANTDLAMTYKAQGGQGLSLSKIRPKGTLIGSRFKSDGIVPFMEMFNKTTESISQGGSRKGALLMSIDVWHKEAPTFITIKRDLNKINKANLSVEIDDDFMSYVATKRSTPVHITRTYEDKPVEYDVNVQDLYNLICESAFKSAEPGIIFTNRFRNYNLMEFVDNYQIETCNPCGEQPLARFSACNLSSINLAKYVINPYSEEPTFDFKQLQKDISIIVRAMDDVLEENIPRHALPEQREMSKKFRNVGIGIMGLADLLVEMGITYGSENSVIFIRSIMKFLFREAVYASVNLAKERGNFPGYSSKVWDSQIIKNAFSKEEIEELKKTDKLRNCSLLSIAPTGSIGTLLNISTGCEPFFALSYNRRTESLNGEETIYKVEVGAVEEYRKMTGNTGDLPDYFVTSNTIHYKSRIEVQAALQDFVDTAISSTINLSKDTTIDDIKDLYLYSWEKGLKGCTIFVEGSRDAILTTEKPEKPLDIPNTLAPKRPKELECDCYTVKSQGENFVVCVGLLDNQPYEVFVFRLTNWLKLPQHKGTITKVEKGKYSLNSDFLHIDNLLDTDINVEEKAATLYSSMLLRHGISIKYIIKTAKKVNQNITSFSSAMCRVLSKYVPTSVGGKCPECGSDTIHEGGCEHCSNPECTWSRCE